MVPRGAGGDARHSLRLLLALVAHRGKDGFPVSKNSYKDFHLRAEFWADATTNSGVFLRLSNPKRIGAAR